MEPFEKGNFYIDGFPPPTNILRNKKEKGWANAIDPSKDPTSISMDDLIKGQGGGSTNGNSKGKDPYGDLTTYLPTPSIKPFNTAPLDFSYDKINTPYTQGGVGRLDNTNRIVADEAKGNSFLTGLLRGMNTIFGNTGNGASTTGNYGVPSKQATGQGGGTAAGDNSQPLTSYLQPAPANTSDKTLLYVAIAGGGLLLIVGLTLAAMGTGSKTTPAKAK